MDEEFTPAMGCGLALLGSLITIPLDALALSLCWNWFVSLVMSWPELSIIKAIGFRIFIGALTRPKDPTLQEFQGKTFREAITERLIQSFSYPIITIIIAFGWHIIEG